jgi:hypothetical protein
MAPVSDATSAGATAVSLIHTQCQKARISSADLPSRANSVTPSPAPGASC